eukprot:s1433_g6.t1
MKPTPVVHEQDPVFVRRSLLDIAIVEECYRKASLRVCMAVRRDDNAFFHDLAEDTGRVAAQGFHRIWNAIKPLLPKWRNRRKSNMQCAGPSIDAQASHYCALEGGIMSDYSTLLKTCHVAQALHIDDLPLSVALPQLPSRIDVENRIQRITVGRAPGVDTISPDEIRRLGPEISEQLGHLVMKMWLTGSEPFQFKGGLLHSISKKVASTKVENMRGIMLIDVIGKVAQALLRQRFLPSLQSWRHPLQLGGFPKCSTLFATQYLRAFHDRARAQNLPSAVLFVDVKSAFHSMIRQLLLGNDNPIPEHLRQLLHEAGCDPAQIAAECDRTSASFLADVPPRECKLLQDAHQFTWFGLAGTDETFCTSRGSRPGSPLADVAFNGAFFESLFQRLAPLESKNFATLRIELQDRRSQLASAATEEGYLEMINDLDTACQLVTEWMDVGAEPRQLLDLLTERVRGRQRQFRYLEVTERYLKCISEKQLEYKRDSTTAPCLDLKQHTTELKDAVGFSLSMKLPHTLSKACNEVGVTPSFQIIQKKMEFVPTLMATKDMADIGCSYIPMATYPVAKLKKMKVLVEVCPPHSAMQSLSWENPL